MKKGLLIGAGIIAIVLGVVGFYFLLPMYNQEPKIDRESLVISKSIDAQGNPQEVIQKAKGEAYSVMDVPKENKEIYVSVKVNDTKLKESKVTLVKQKTGSPDVEIDTKIVKYGNSEYYNYHITDLDKLETQGVRYMVSFFNDDGVADAQLDFILK